MASNSRPVNAWADLFSRRLDTDYPSIIVRSPARINLIGEHTDYNQGFVMPAAINRYIYLALSARAGTRCRLYASDLDEYWELDLNEIHKSEKRWANYLIGVADQFIKLGYRIGGFDCLFGGDIPLGAGLSSSAAIEAGLGFGLSRIFGLDIRRESLAKLAQAAENEFVGVQCGIMDQFANLLGRERTVFRLDCRSLEFDYHPFLQDAAELVLCDTGVKHELASSEYNLRRQQCEEGARKLSAVQPQIVSLRDVSIDFLEERKDLLGPVVYKRCRYVLEENRRVEMACECLEEGNAGELGRLLYSSHEGLRRDYEVSCRELDVLVDAAAGMNGVIGARMMGGGFGGCTLNLVAKAAVTDFKRKIAERYREGTGLELKFYECNLVSGTHLLSE